MRAWTVIKQIKGIDKQKYLKENFVLNIIPLSYKGNCEKANKCEYKDM